MIASVHSIYSQSVHALALNAGSMDKDAGLYCNANLVISGLYLVTSNYVTLCL